MHLFSVKIIYKNNIYFLFDKIYKRKENFISMISKSENEIGLIKLILK